MESSSFGSTSSCLLSVHGQNCLPFQIIRCIFIALTGQYQVYYITRNRLITEGKTFVPQKTNFHVITLPGDRCSVAHLQKQAFNRLMNEQNLTSSKDTMPAPRAPTCQCGGRLRFPVHLHWACSIAVSVLSEESLALLNLILPQRRQQNSQSDTVKVCGLCSQRTILFSKYWFLSHQILQTKAAETGQSSLEASENYPFEGVWASCGDPPHILFQKKENESSWC